MSAIDHMNLIDQSVYYRGVVIHKMSLLEQFINIYLSTHFCGANTTESEEMQLLILGDDRMSLSSKVHVFKHISEKHEKEWLNSYVKGSKGFFKDLTHSIEQRNIFAHRTIDVTAGIHRVHLPPNTVRFVKFKNEIGSTDYDEQTFKAFTVMLDELINFIEDNLRPKVAFQVRDL
jgi:hypothetical protein